ncbi:STAS domain-containing protein [Planosporangium mesophilum]|nr:STAS domain-containing protein [Planosporangium mesophilum]NJC82801.1 STAS domain-containing protein [Planosporangium mesophilum]
MTFTHQVRADGSGLVIALCGEMDLSVADGFEAMVRRLITRRRPGTVQLDLAELRFIDSTAVSVIVRLWRLARREHCCLRVVNPTGLVYRVLDVTGALAVVGGDPAPDRAPGVPSS